MSKLIVSQARSQNNSGQQSQEVVYLSCPKRLQHNEAYNVVLSQLYRRHPVAAILDTALLWKYVGSSSHAYRLGLAHVTLPYVVVPSDGIVDKTCYDEWLYFKERGMQTIAFTSMGITPVRAMLLLAHSRENYAVVVTELDRE